MELGFPWSEALFLNALGMMVTIFPYWQSKITPAVSIAFCWQALAALQGRWFQFSQSSKVHLLSTGVLELCRVLGLCPPCPLCPSGGFGLGSISDFCHSEVEIAGNG